jgi:hypothetical protein
MVDLMFRPWASVGGMSGGGRGGSSEAPKSLIRDAVGFIRDVSQPAMSASSTSKQTPLWMPGSRIMNRAPGRDPKGSVVILAALREGEEGLVEGFATHMDHHLNKTGAPQLEERERERGGGPHN